MSQQHRITYDLLDPSDFCLQQWNKINNKSPYFIRNKYNKTLEDASILQDEYDVVWAMHSLYNLDKTRLKTSLKKLHSALKKNGTGIIYIADSDSFYCSFYRKFIHFYKKEKLEWVNSNDITRTMQSLDIPFEIKKLNFYHKIHIKNQHLLEVYLSKSSYELYTPLGYWFDNKKMGDFLRKFIIEKEYIFPQSIDIIVYKS